MFRWMSAGANSSSRRYEPPKPRTVSLSDIPTWVEQLAESSGVSLDQVHIPASPSADGAGAEDMAGAPNAASPEPSSAISSSPLSLDQPTLKHTTSTAAPSSAEAPASAAAAGSAAAAAAPDAGNPLRAAALVRAQSDLSSLRSHRTVSLMPESSASPIGEDSGPGSSSGSPAAAASAAAEATAAADVPEEEEGEGGEEEDHGDEPAPLLDAVVAHKVSLYRGDITSLKIDAIVNAANSSLYPGGGVCGAIHSAAGNALARECYQIGRCPTGSAVLTAGYRLPAKHVVHAVGPIGEDPRALASAYWESLELCRRHNLRSIAFCCISTGIFGFPQAAAAKIALQTTEEWLRSPIPGASPPRPRADLMDRVIFCVFLAKDEQLYLRYMPKVFPLPLLGSAPASASAAAAAAADPQAAEPPTSAESSSQQSAEATEEVPAGSATPILSQNYASEAESASDQDEDDPTGGHVGAAPLPPATTALPGDSGAEDDADADRFGDGDEEIAELDFDFDDAGAAAAAAAAREEAAPAAAAADGAAAGAMDDDGDVIMRPTKSMANM